MGHRSNVLYLSSHPAWRERREAQIEDELAEWWFLALTDERLRELLARPALGYYRQLRAV